MTKLDLTNRGVSGRLYRVTLYGSAGKKTVSADVFVSVFNAGRPAGSAPLREHAVRHQADQLAGADPYSSRRRNRAIPASSTSTTHTTLQATNAGGGGLLAKNGLAAIASGLRPAAISSTSGGSRP